MSFSFTCFDADNTSVGVKVHIVSVTIQVRKSLYFAQLTNIKTQRWAILEPAQQHSSNFDDRFAWNVRQRWNKRSRIEERHERWFWWFPDRVVWNLKEMYHYRPSLKPKKTLNRAKVIFMITKNDNIRQLPICGIEWQIWPYRREKKHDTTLLDIFDS